MRALTGRWHHFRRTRRAAVALVAVGGVMVASADLGAAQEEPFNAGTGTASASGYTVNPVFGNLSFGITAGLSLAGHQNTEAQAISRSVDTGVIGQTMAGEGCDGGDPTWAEEDQPKSIMAESDNPKTSRQDQEFEGAIHMAVEATPEPFGEAVTTIGPLGDPAGALIEGGETTASSGVVAEGVREARAATVIGSVELGGGAIQIGDMTWEAVHRSGAEEVLEGKFTIGSLVVNGQAQEMSGDDAQDLEQLNTVLNELGFQVKMPRVRVEQNIVFVDPMKIGIIKNETRDSLLGPIFEGAQPFREQLAEALLEQDCGNATYITVLDIALGTFTGAGSLNLELGGVQATTEEIDIFEFPGFPTTPPPALPPSDLPESPVPPSGDDEVALPDSSSTPSSPVVPSSPSSSYTPSSSSSSSGSPSSYSPPSASSPSSSGTPSASAPSASSGPSAPPSNAGTGTTPAPQGNEVATMQTKKIANLTGARGGLLAAISGLGLALLLITAEGDRRKMRRALRQIPQEA